MKRDPKEEMKKQIRTRFGSVKRFCEVFNLQNNFIEGKSEGIEGFNYQFLMKVFSGRIAEERTNFALSYLQNLILNSDIKDHSHLIDEKDRDFVRMRILINFRNVSTFVRLNDQFTPVFIHNIIAGKRKKKDRRFNELINLLKNEDIK